MTSDLLSTFEYTLKLSTGESVEFAEIDLAIQSPDVCEFISHSPLCSRITKCSREDIEAAKLGYDKALRLHIKSPPKIMLLKTTPEYCYLRHDCSSFSSDVCTLKTKKAIPDCFEFDHSEPIASQVMTELTRFWKNNMHAVIITS